jgi:hypothetical protein
VSGAGYEYQTAGERQGVVAALKKAVKTNLVRYDVSGVKFRTRGFDFCARPKHALPTVEATGNSTSSYV